MSRLCKFTNKKANNGYSISRSHVRNKKRQEINLQSKKVWSCKKQKWVKMKLTTKAIKSIDKLSLLI